MKKEDIARNHIHLTNVAVQKKSESVINGDTREEGSKWGIQQLKLYIASRHGMSAANAMCGQIQDVMIQTLLSVTPVMINDKQCFELYGFDVMLDDALKPWLIEVNSSPALTATSKGDFDHKYQLLSDVLDVIDVEGRRTGEETRVGGFDLVWHGEHAMGGPSPLGSYLEVKEQQATNASDPEMVQISTLESERPEHFLKAGIDSQ